MLDIDNGMSLIKDTVACGGVKEPPIGSSWIGKKKINAMCHGKQ